MNADQAQRRIQDRLDWTMAHGPRPRAVPRVPLVVRLKRQTKAAILAVPGVGPWLFVRLQELRGWLARRQGAR
jgi:hypothetical protein